MQLEIFTFYKAKRMKNDRLIIFFFTLVVKISIFFKSFKINNSERVIYLFVLVFENVCCLSCQFTSRSSVQRWLFPAFAVSLVYYQLLTYR